MTYDDRPRCAGCDCEFNAVCKPARIIFWDRSPGMVARLCQGCLEEVVIFYGEGSPQDPPQSQQHEPQPEDPDYDAGGPYA